GNIGTKLADYQEKVYSHPALKKWLDERPEDKIFSCEKSINFRGQPGGQPVVNWVNVWKEL
ncbi:unnamed protein product, partial [Mesorhabditis belari]